MIQIFGIDALSVLIFGPALAAFAVAALAALAPSQTLGRWTALVFSILLAILSIAVFFDYQAAAPAIGAEAVYRGARCRVV